MTPRSDRRKLHVTPKARVDAEQRAAQAFIERRTAEPSEHICGNCRTPMGRSSLPCKNDPNRRTP